MAVIRRVEYDIEREARACPGYFVIFVIFVVEDIFVAFVVDIRCADTERWPSTQ